MPRRIAFGRGEVRVLATVSGLVSERARVREAFDAARPAAIALGVAPEAAATLARYERLPDENPFEDLPDHDYVYSVKLGEFGAVDLPPPDLLEAARLATAAGVPLFGVDLPEEAYEDAFTKEVSTLGFLRYGRIQRRLARKPPRAPDAIAFALAWDAAIRRVRGIARVEALREARIAEGAQALAERHASEGHVLLVLDVARAEGVLARLLQAGGLPDEPSP